MSANRQIYYDTLFPSELVYNWLCYENTSNIAHREIAFCFENDSFLRFQSFPNLHDFQTALDFYNPAKIDIGAVYSKDFAKRKTEEFFPIEKELVFDIDITDYDNVRNCCKDKNVCKKCWKYLTIASRIINEILTLNFGYKHILWVFSGRRGIHIWVCDKYARILKKADRVAVLRYICLPRLKDLLKMQRLTFSMLKSVKIIDEYIEEILTDQKLLKTQENVENLLQYFDNTTQQIFLKEMLCFSTSLERWNIFLATFDKLSKNNQIPSNLSSFVNCVKLFWCYPRIDVNVSTDLTHLIKIPFSLHPKTLNVCVPIRLENIAGFDLNNVVNLQKICEVVSVAANRNGKLMKRFEMAFAKHTDVLSEFLRKLQKEEDTSHCRSVIYDCLASAFDQIDQKIKMENITEGFSKLKASEPDIPVIDVFSKYLNFKK